MLKRTLTANLTALAVLLLTLTFISKGLAQDAPQDISQDPGPKQEMHIVYPDEGIVLEGKGDDAVRYKGTLYVKVFAVSPRLIKKYGSDPVFTDELSHGNHPSPSFPWGKYEVQFSMREGDTMRTYIKRDVLLTGNGDTTVEAEMSGTTQTLIIGGDDMTAKEMRDSIVELKKQVAELQAQVAALKAGAK